MLAVDQNSDRMHVVERKIKDVDMQLQEFKYAQMGNQPSKEAMGLGGARTDGAGSWLGRSSTLAPSPAPAPSPLPAPSPSPAPTPSPSPPSGDNDGDKQIPSNTYIDSTGGVQRQRSEQRRADDEWHSSPHSDPWAKMHKGPEQSLDAGKGGQPVQAAPWGSASHEPPPPPPPGPTD